VYRRARGDAAMSRISRVFLRAQDRDQLIQEKRQPVYQLGFGWGWNLSGGELRTRPIENLSTMGDEKIMEHERKLTRSTSVRSPGRSSWNLDGY
jgi:hypothetical protein